MTLKPADEVPGSTGNDEVVDNHFNLLFVGQPLEVYQYLQVPGNMGDTTMCVYSMTAPAPYYDTSCYATNYLDWFSTVYPDIVIPS